MIRSLAMTAVLISALAATPAAASPSEDQVRQSNTAEVAALLASDTRTLAALWSDDMVVTNPLNKFVTKQQVLGMTASGFIAMSAYSRSIDYVHLYGPMAVVAGTEAVTWAGKFPLAGQTSTLRFTAVWRDDGGTWREVARHANIVLPSTVP